MATRCLGHEGAGHRLQSGAQRAARILHPALLLVFQIRITGALDPRDEGFQALDAQLDGHTLHRLTGRIDHQRFDTGRHVLLIQPRRVTQADEAIACTKRDIRARRNALAAIIAHTALDAQHAVHHALFGKGQLELAFTACIERRAVISEDLRGARWLLIRKIEVAGHGVGRAKGLCLQLQPDPRLRIGERTAGMQARLHAQGERIARPHALAIGLRCNLERRRCEIADQYAQGLDEGLIVATTDLEAIPADRRGLRDLHALREAAERRQADAARGPEHLPGRIDDAQQIRQIGGRDQRTGVLLAHEQLEIDAVAKPVDALRGGAPGAQVTITRTQFGPHLPRPQPVLTAQRQQRDIAIPAHLEQQSRLVVTPAVEAQQVRIQRVHTGQACDAVLVRNRLGYHRRTGLGKLRRHAHIHLHPRTCDRGTAGELRNPDQRAEMAELHGGREWRHLREKVPPTIAIRRHAVERAADHAAAPAEHFTQAKRHREGQILDCWQGQRVPSIKVLAARIEAAIARRDAGQIGRIHRQLGIDLRFQHRLRMRQLQLRAPMRGAQNGVDGRGKGAAEGIHQRVARAQPVVGKCLQGNRQPHPVACAGFVLTPEIGVGSGILPGIESRPPESQIGPHLQVARHACGGHRGGEVQRHGGQRIAFARTLVASDRDLDAPPVIHAGAGEAEKTEFGKGVQGKRHPLLDARLGSLTPQTGFDAQRDRLVRSSRSGRNNQTRAGRLPSSAARAICSSLAPPASIARPAASAAATRTATRSCGALSLLKYRCCATLSRLTA